METDIEYTPAQAEAEIAAICTDLGITFRVSAPKAEARDGWECLTYEVTATKGKAEVSFDYRLGMGHIPRDAWRRVIDHPYRYLRLGDVAVDAAKKALGQGGYVTSAEWLSCCQTVAQREKIAPDPAAALASLAEDASRAVETKFEEWANNFGYSPDSRKAENIWLTCREHYTRLRTILSHDDIERLARLAVEL